MLSGMAKRQYKDGLFLGTCLFLHRHGGLEERYGSARRWDPTLKRDFSEYLQEALEKGWQVVHETPPRVFFEAGGNLLRRVRGYEQLIDRFLPTLDLVVTVDWRMSNTALHSDYVFPAAGWYEEDDICWGSPVAPFCHVTTRAVEPVGSSRSDWEIHCLLIKKLQERPIAPGIVDEISIQLLKRKDLGRLDRLPAELLVLHFEVCERFLCPNGHRGRTLNRAARRRGNRFERSIPHLVRRRRRRQLLLGGGKRGRQKL